MRVLVTGAAGFIGFHLSRALLARGDDVVGVDSLNDYYDPALKRDRLALLGSSPGFAFVRADIADPSFREIAAKHEGTGFDRVCNLAAQAGVRYSIDHPEEYVRSNVVGFLNVLEYCRSRKTAHLVYASSSSVYGQANRLPLSAEDGTDRPASLYAATKKADELMAHCYASLYGLPATGLRFFTVYGPWGRPDMAYFKFADAILAGRPIDVYNGGKLRRDFTYVDDIVAGVMAVLDGVPGPDAMGVPCRVYNIGNSKTVGLDRFIEVLESAIGGRADKRLLPMQAGDVMATEADIEPMRRDFGWEPRTRLEDGLAAFAAWHRERYGAPAGSFGGKR